MNNRTFPHITTTKLTPERDGKNNKMQFSKFFMCCICFAFRFAVVQCNIPLFPFIFRFLLEQGKLAKQKIIPFLSLAVSLRITSNNPFFKENCHITK